MILNILISTIDEGISKVPDVLLPIRSDVHYIISHQYQQEKFLKIPDELNRSDVTIDQIYGKGLTKSRNNALKLANGDICVIADDDVRYTDEYINTIFKYHRDRESDIICFKIDTGESGIEYKKYAREEKQITFVKPHKLSPNFISSVEITFKLKSIRENKLMFDERFGLGSKFTGEEEFLFILDAINLGLSVLFIPEFIVRHPYESTIRAEGYDLAKIDRMTAAVDARVNGVKAIIRTFKITTLSIIFFYRFKRNPFRLFYNRLYANLYILLNK